MTMQNETITPTLFFDPILNTPTNPINLEKLDFDLEEMRVGMHTLLGSFGGIGLSANQVGIPLSVFVIGNGVDLEETKMFINPVIVSESREKKIMDEGCISYPSLILKIIRPETVKIRYYDEKLTEREEFFTGMTARIIQHEMCHIRGETFFAKLSSFNLKRQLTNNPSSFTFNVLRKYLK